MSQYLINNVKTNLPKTDTQKTQDIMQISRAADDVHRTAMRNPSLYKTNKVPRVETRFPTSFRMENRGMV
jgi:hypothetical protein